VHELPRVRQPAARGRPRGGLEAGRDDDGVLEQEQLLAANPLNRGRAITLTFDQFKYRWANALDESEARHLYDTYHVAGPGVALAQMANANVNPFTEAKGRPPQPRPRPAADHRRREGPHRPLGDRPRRLQAPEAQPVSHRDHQDPQPRHSLTIDNGWREVAQTALDFVKRFA
jgi:non-heme chloroperoxidase